MIRRRSQSGQLADRKLWLFGATALFIAAVFTVLGYQLWLGYRDALALARSVTGNFATTTDAELDSALRLVDVELQEVARDHRAPGPREARRFAEELDRRFELRRRSSPEIRAFRAFDRNGEQVYASKNAIGPAFNIRERAYFRKLREDPTIGSVFEALLTRSSAQQPILVIARALLDERGEFGGVLVAALDISYFHKRFDSMRLLERDVVSIYSTEDFSGVMRWPSSGKANFKLPESNPVPMAIRGGARSGSATVRSAADGVDRIYSYKVLERYPFVVLCGLALEDVLAEWRTRAVGVGVVAAVLALMLVALVHSLWQARLRSANLADEKTRSEARTRRILDTALDAVVLSDARGVVVGWNAKASELFGYSELEAVGRPVSDLIVPAAAREAHERGLANAVRSPDIRRDGLRMEMNARRADGTEFPVEMAVSVAGDGDDRLFAAFLHDIGPRREREHSLSETRKYLEALLELLPDGVNIHNQGMVEYANVAAEQIFGSNMVGRSIFDFCQPQVVEQVRERFAAIYRGETVAGRVELPAISGTGAPIFIEASSILVMQSGEPRILSVFRDTTERRKKEQELRESEARLRSVIDLIPNVLRAKDPDGRYLLSNRAHAQLYGRTQQEILGRAGDKIGLPVEKVALADALDAEVRRTGEPLVTPEYRAADEEGKEHIYRTIRVPFGPETGWPGAVLAVGTDITDLMQAQERVSKLNAELEQRVEERTRDLTVALKDLETFNYSVSHDLRAPLRAVSGFIGVTLDQFEGQVGPDARKYLERVRSAAGSMSDIVEGLLSLARMSREPMVRSPVALSDLARVVFEELDIDPARRIEFTLEETPVARADPKQVHVVIQNLLANAVKYSRGRHPAKIRFGSELKDGEVVYVVSDNGAGFDPQYADNLFKPFGRLHSAREFEGTGIGLATVHRIVERHGGRIWAEAKVGEGATFRFTLGRTA